MTSVLKCITGDQLAGRQEPGRADWSVIYRVKNHKRKDNVHIARLPDMFRGKFRPEEVEEDPGLLYAREVEHKILRAEAQGRGVAAYIGEPLFVIPGIFIPPVSYYKHLYK